MSVSAELNLTRREIESLGRLSDSELDLVLQQMTGRSSTQSPSQITRRSTWTNEQVNEHQKGKQLVSREVGDIPDIENPSERENAKWDLKYDMERYHAPMWTLEWSRAHLDLIQLMQDLFLEDDFSAAITAMPRGSGKTSLTRCAVEWAIRHGHCRWPLLIEADDDAFKKQMRAFHVEFRSNVLLAADFPETIGIFRRMSSPKSAPGLMCRGEIMHAEFKSALIVMPTNYLSLELGTAGGVISGGGITGSVRGAQIVVPTGEVIRPDVVLANDIQTRESAGSPKQVQERCEIMGADLFGCGGPGKKVKPLVTVTVIKKDDLADRMLGPSFPQYRPQRVKWLNKWPTNTELWAQYSALYRRLLVEEQPLKAANDFYSQHRECRYGLGWHVPGLDHGAEVYWEPRIDTPFLSSLQTFMSWYAVDPKSAMAEGQNEPEDEFEADDVVYASREQILAKTSTLKRLEVPNDAVELVAFIDMQQEVLIGGVMAICPGFRRYVVDYGTFPDQKRGYWTKGQLAVKLSEFWGSHEECWYEGLKVFTKAIEQTEFRKQNGQRVHISLGLIDARDGDMTDTVFKFCVDHGHGVWYPSYGIYIGATTNPLNHGSESKAWKTKHNEWGPNWNLSNDAARGHDRYAYDSNWWKSKVHIGLTTPEVDPMSLQFWNGDHDLLSDHIRAEYPLKTEGRGRECTEFKLRPGQDNDLLDVISGCSVAGSIRKVMIPGTEGMHFRKKKKRVRRITQNEVNERFGR